MARLPRYYLAEHPQHVIIRGNNASRIFREDNDYLFYLEILTRACLKHSCDLHAYVLMPTHVHLLLTPHREQSIGKVVQMLGRYYVQYYNQTYQRKGTLWEGRYKATLVDSQHYLLACSQYIELNPVRSGLSQTPEQYIWSSYGYNAMGKANGLVTPHTEYLDLGPTQTTRQDAYRQLCQNPLPQKVIDRIREATNKSWVLGDENYKRSIANVINRRTEPKPKGGDRRSEQFRQMQQRNTQNVHSVSSTGHT